MRLTIALLLITLKLTGQFTIDGKVIMNNGLFYTVNYEKISVQNSYLFSTVQSDSTILLSLIYSPYDTVALYRSTNQSSYSLIGEIDSVFSDTVDMGTVYYYKTKNEIYESNVTTNIYTPAYSMTGTDRINIPISDSLTFDMTEPFSFETWARFGTSAVNDTFFSITNSSHHLSFVVNSALELQFRALATATTDELLEKTKASSSPQYVVQTVPANTTMHLAVTYDGSKDVSGVEMYVNGLNIVQVTESPNTLTSTLSFGSADYVIGGTTFTQGPFRWFRKELSQAEITTLYNQGLPLKSTSISRLVGEYLLINDSLNGSTYYVLDSYGNDGTTINTSGNELTFLDDLRGLDIAPVMYSGNDTTGMRLDLQGRAHEGSNFGGDNVNWSPKPESQNWPQSIYLDDNSTYVQWHYGGQRGYSMENSILKIDNTNNVIVGSKSIGVTLEGLTDGHANAAIIKQTNSGNLLLAMNKHHNGDVYIYTMDTALNNVNQIATIDPYYRFDYPQLAYLADTLYIFGRGDSSMAATSYYKSVNNGQSWSTGYEVVDSITTRSYHSLMKYENTIHLIVRQKDDGDSKYMFRNVNYLKSQDALLWYNVDSSKTFDIREHPILQDSLNTYFEVCGHDAIDKGFDLFSWDWDDSGNPEVLVFDNVDSVYQMYYWNVTEWDSIVLPMPVQYVPHENFQFAGQGQLVRKSDNNYDVFFNRVSGSDYAVYKFSTTDNFATVDSVQLSEAGRTHWYMHRTQNIQSGKDVVVTSNSYITGSSKQKGDLFIYKYEP